MLKKIKNLLLRNNSTSQTVAKNTIWLLTGETWARLFRAAIIIYAARALGTINYGVFSYAITLAGFFTIFSDIGINALLNRETAKNPELTSKYLSTSFFIKIILIFISVLLIIFAAPYFTKIPGVRSLLVIVSLVLTFDSIRDFSYSINRAMEKMEREAFSRLLTNVAIATFGFLFLAISPTPKSLAFAYALGSASGTILMLWFLRSYFKNLLSNFSPNLLRKILFSAWPFALMGLMSGIMLNTDTIMLGWWKTATDLGLYSAAQRPIQLFYVIPGLLSAATFPTLARLAIKDNLKFKNIFEKIVSLSLVMALPATIISIMFGREIMGILFGVSYLSASLTFQLLSLTLFITFPSVLIGNGVFAYNEQKSFTFLIGLGALGNVAFNYLLIPKWGIEGSAVATIIAQILSNGFLYLKMKKINPFSIFPHIKKGLVASVIMIVIIYFLKYLGVNFFINLITALVIYGLVLLVTKDKIVREIGDILRLS